MPVGVIQKPVDKILFFLIIMDIMDIFHLLNVDKNENFRPPNQLQLSVFNDPVCHNLDVQYWYFSITKVK